MRKKSGNTQAKINISLSEKMLARPVLSFLILIFISVTEAQEAVSDGQQHQEDDRSGIRWHEKKSLGSWLPPSQQPPPPPVNPDDSLEKIKSVKNNVLELMKQAEVSNGKGISKSGLLGTLFENILKLDAIDSKGNEYIRQARREVIIWIQNYMSKLEGEATEATSMESKRLPVTKELQEQAEKKTGVLQQPVQAAEEAPKTESNLVCMPNEEFPMGCKTCYCNDNGGNFICDESKCEIVQSQTDTDISEVRPTRVDSKPEMDISITKAPEAEYGPVCIPNQEFPIGCKTCYCNDYGDNFTCNESKCEIVQSQTDNIHPTKVDSKPEMDNSLRSDSKDLWKKFKPKLKHFFEAIQDEDIKFIETSIHSIANKYKAYQELLETDDLTSNIRKGKTDVQDWPMMNRNQIGAVPSLFFP